MNTAHRTVFFVSDGTGITAETFGQAVLAQFDFSPKHVRLPFVDSVEKAQEAVKRINHVGEAEGKRPIVFTTVAAPDVQKVFETQCHGRLMDLIGRFVEPLEEELGIKSHHRIGRFSDKTSHPFYSQRMEAINFTMIHDDGQSHDHLDESGVILVGVSRSGKTPTSLYLAMQHGVKCANYPLIPEDFERNQLPSVLLPYKDKIFGLTISAERLSEIRNERRPNSKYASLTNCRQEVHDAEVMMRRSGIEWLNTTTKSVEEISTTILQKLKPERLSY